MPMAMAMAMAIPFARCCCSLAVAVGITPTYNYKICSPRYQINKTLVANLGEMRAVVENVTKNKPGFGELAWKLKRDRPLFVPGNFFLNLEHFFFCV